MTNEQRHEISNNVVCATSKASDQPAHTRSLIRAFACRLNSLWTEHHLEFLSLNGGFTGASEFIIVKMPHCWKSRVTAQLLSCHMLAPADCTRRLRKFIAKDENKRDSSREDCREVYG